MNTFLIFYGILIHFLADFALQTYEQATGKGIGNSLLNKQLFYHAGIYTIIWVIAIHALIGINFNLLAFAYITFTCHYLTDWCTSRIGKPYWSKGDFHNGFVIVGFDQMLHYIQLYYTFKLLFL